jgi:predicted acetyltransferase
VTTRDARLAVRTMRPGEEEMLAGTGARSFRSGERELWLRNVYQNNPYLAADDTLVATIGGRIAGHASGYRFTMGLAGRDVPVRGIAAVAVVPEFRRRGVADALMVGLHRQMRRRGEALSMLYAFRMSFYRKFGYGVVEWADHLRVAPARLPASPLRKHVRYLNRPDDEALVRRVYEKSRALGTGAFVREDAWWQIRIWPRANEGVVYVDPRTKRPQGYALYDVPAEPPYPRQQAQVKELIALTPDAFRGLIGYFEALGDQYRMLELTLPPGEGRGLLKDFEYLGAPESLRMFQTTGLAAGGAMLRLVDVAEAFALHPGPAKNGARGRIGLDLEDPVFPAQGRGLDVTFGARGARVRPGRTARDRIALPVASLAQIYMGGASARVLLAQGLATGSPRAAEKLDRAFEGPPAFLGVMNGF